MYANYNSGTSCRYSFNIGKPGYKSVYIDAESFAASSQSNTVYLVTPIKDVAGPSLASSDPAVCDPLTNTLDTEGYYLNGVALVAAPLFNGNQGIAVNEHASGYLPSFRLAPLVTDVINCNNHIGISKVLS